MNTNIKNLVLLLALTTSLGLIMAGRVTAQTVNVLGFSSTKNGLKFDNDDWPEIPPWNINLPIVGNLPIGNANNGLCGGMAYLVRDCFDANLLPPTTATLPAVGAPLFTYIVARLTHSFDYDDCNQQISWITKGDADLVNHMVQEEWPKVKSVIDSGEPCPLALTHGHTVITDISGIAQSLGGCHQVLAYGYTLQGNHLTLRIWDPDDSPGTTTSTIQISLAIQGLTDTQALNWMTITANHPTNEFRGFFRSHYSFKDPRQPTTAAFIAQAVSSPGISNLQPLPAVAIKRIWAQATGNPLVRYSGTVHDFTVPVTSFVADNGKPIEQLMVTITTGSDDLRAGTGPDDNADIFLTVGGNLGNRTLIFRNINSNQQWGNGEVHNVILPLPPGAVSDDILSLRLHTQFGGGLSGDNWNVNEIAVAGFLPLSAGNVAGPVTRIWLTANGNPLVRFTGNIHDWSNPVRQSAADVGKPVRELNLTVTTGSDDLRAGTGPDDNADVILTTTTDQTIKISNINQSQNWGNDSVHSVTLPTPAGLTADKIANFDLHTQFGGGMGGDNWNVNELNLQATLDNSGPANGNSNPQPVQLTLVNQNGNYIVRFTGSTHDWSTPVNNTAADAGKSIVNLNLTIITGSDDLRGGNNSSDNADVILTLSNGQTISVDNINAGQDWGNNSVHTVSLQIPNGLHANDIVKFALHTQFGGGMGGDNWNVNGIKLTAIAE
jgi:hypothetical protein